MKVDFGKDRWDPELFTQVTSRHTEGRIPFMQEEDCVVNDTPKEGLEDLKKYRYISLISKEWFHSGVELETVCEFDSYGAPLIVLSDDIEETEDGYPVYGHHFEIVAFEEGFNVWEIYGAKPTKVALGRFPVPGGKPITLSVKVLEEELIVTLCGQTQSMKVANLPRRFHGGITACEGVNRFYSFTTKE